MFYDIKVRYFYRYLIDIMRFNIFMTCKKSTCPVRIKTGAHPVRKAPVRID